MVTNNVTVYQFEERRMQPARGRFARFDLDRQIASTFPAHWKVGPAPSSRWPAVYFAVGSGPAVYSAV